MHGGKVKKPTLSTYSQLYLFFAQRQISIRTRFLANTAPTSACAET